ncbi:putative non-specific serine/threonine protein kinase [Helianthus annuus]|nr:putative non-specific serine/threonine protein kinase [Helianthus annuus]
MLCSKCVRDLELENTLLDGNPEPRLKSFSIFFVYICKRGYMFHLSFHTNCKLTICRGINDIPGIVSYLPNLLKQVTSFFLKL